MNRIFARDIVIAVLLSVITAMILKEPCLVYCLPLPWLFCVLGLEEYAERLMRCVHGKRIIRKLRNRKVLPPASKQD